MTVNVDAISIFQAMQRQTVLPNTPLSTISSGGNRLRMLISDHISTPTNHSLATNQSVYSSKHSKENFSKCGLPTAPSFVCLPSYNWGPAYLTLNSRQCHCIGAFFWRKSNLHFHLEAHTLTFNRRTCVIFFFSQAIQTSQGLDSRQQQHANVGKVD